MNQTDSGGGPGDIAIEAIEVSKVFGTGSKTVRALDDVSVTINENEFFTLLGPSGCGKTTLLRLIAGFDHPDEGRILLSGAPIGHLPPFQRSVNTVFQNYALFPHMTVAENISFGLEMLGKPSGETEKNVGRMLDLVQMESLADRKISQLSGGQQQRVALARALAPHPKVLLLDEPLSALDLKLRKEMQIELKRLQLETGITFIFVTHDQEEALTMSDRIAVMNEGRIRQIGTPRQIYDSPAERFVAHFIGETNFIEGELVSVDERNGRVRFASGVELDASLPNDEMAPGRVSIVIRPEHAELLENEDVGVFHGEVHNVVYFGTDTHYHLRLDDGTPFMVRAQNSRDNTPVFVEGTRAGVAVKNNTVQVLVD